MTLNFKPRARQLCLSGVLLGVWPARSATIATWNFEEGSGGAIANGTILDSSGNGLNGTAIGAPVYVTDAGSVPGSNLGLYFNGTSSRVFVADSPLFELSAFTIDAYIRYDGPLGCCRSEIAYYGDDQGQLSYSLGITNGYLDLRLGDARGNLFGDIATQPLPVGVFVHVTGTFDEATHMANLYLNGAPVGAQGTLLVHYIVFDPAHSPGIGIGGTQNASSPLLFHGVIDNLTISGDVATPEPATFGLLGIGLGALLLLRGMKPH